MKLSFLTTDLSLSQSNLSLIYGINKFLEKRFDIDIAVFYENKVQPCYPLDFATTNVVDAWDYSGNIIATNITTASKILNFPRSKNKYFYVFDLEWINMQDKSYEETSHVYQNDSLKLLARSDEHANKIEKTWNRSVYRIIDDFNIDDIVQMIQEDENGYRKN